MKGKKAPKAKAPDKSAGDNGNDVLVFPQRRIMEPTTREKALAEISRAGVTLDPGLLRLLRLPNLLVRGMNESLEFFDVMSNQPFPAHKEDSPPQCYAEGKAAPTWVSQRYISITEEDGKRFLTFIDAPRQIFIKEDVSDLAAIRSILYDKIMSVREPAAT